MTADPSPARVAAERGRSERREADRWHPSSPQPAEPASPVPAPTLDGQRDAESRDELRAELVELLRRYGLQIPTAQRWLDDFERAVERQIRESIAGEIEAQHREWRRIYPGYAVGNATFNEGLDLAARIARRVSS